jgi:glycine cleavage system aminomethyltransferase T
MSDPNVAAAYERSVFLGAEGKEKFAHSPYVPYDPVVDHYEWAASGYPFLVPWEYTGWRDEQLSWKKTCYLSGGLNPTATYRISGPEAARFLSEHLVNNIAKFPVGTAKHGIMLNEDGYVVSDGVIIRTDHDEYVTFWMAPYIAYALAKSGYDATGEDITLQSSLYQVAGPKSLEILEKATGENLRDIEFLHFRYATIAGQRVRVLRLGMGGSLSYEVHGDLEHGREIYSAIWEAGKPLGMRKLGIRTYMMNHTENGFPQAYYHFAYPWLEDEGFAEFLAQIPGVTGAGQMQRGSYDTDPRARYRTPIELGWRRMINLDHDFVGKQAVLAEIAAPRRTMVTLVWNEEDILDVHRSQYRDDDPYQNLDEPNRFTFTDGANTLWNDRVLANGTLVGVSSGRCYSVYYRAMLSLASIDIEFAVEGTEVAVLWGEPGTRQKPIRAVVSRFPYLNEGRNETIDVTSIPAGV